MFLSFVAIAVLGIVAYLIVRSKTKLPPQEPSVNPASLETGARSDDTVPLGRHGSDI